MTEIPVDVVIGAKDSASAEIKKLGDTMKTAGTKADDLKKSNKDLNTTFSEMQGLVQGLAAGLLVKTMASWVTAAANAQKETFQVDNNLKNAAKSTEYLTQTIRGNRKELENQTEALQSQIKYKKNQIDILELSGAGHEAEIKSIQSEINALKLQELQTENTAVVKDRFVQVINKNKLSFEALKLATDEVSEAYIKLGFDDEETALVFSKNLQITKDVTEAKKMLGLEADLARAKNIGLSEAGTAVTLAMTGSSRILKQFGIDLDDNATKAQVMDALLQRVGGSAEAYSKSYSGALDTMKVSWQNLQETLGTQFLPILAQVTDKLTLLIVEIQKNPDAIAIVIGAFVALAAVLTGAAMVALLGVIGFAGATGLAILALVAVVGAAVGYLILHFKTLQQNVKDIWDNLVLYFKDVAAPAIEKFLNYVGDRIKAWTGTWAENFEKFKGVVVSVADAIRSVMDLAQKAVSFGTGIRLPGRQTGGTVPGAIGEPALVYAHGGENISPYGKTAGQSSAPIAFNVTIGMYAGTETEKRNIARDLYSALSQLAAAQNKTVAELMGR